MNKLFQSPRESIKVGDYVVFAVERLESTLIRTRLPEYDKSAIIPIEHTSPEGYIKVAAYDVAVVIEVKDDVKEPIKLSLKDIDSTRRVLVLESYMDKIKEARLEFLRMAGALNPTFLRSQEGSLLFEFPYLDYKY